MLNYFENTCMFLCIEKEKKHEKYKGGKNGKLASVYIYIIFTISQGILFKASGHSLSKFSSIIVKYGCLMYSYI